MCLRNVLNFGFPPSFSRTFTPKIPALLKCDTYYGRHPVSFPLHHDRRPIYQLVGWMERNFPMSPLDRPTGFTSSSSSWRPNGRPTARPSHVGTHARPAIQKTSRNPLLKMPPPKPKPKQVRFLNIVRIARRLPKQTAFGHYDFS